MKTIPEREGGARVGRARPARGADGATIRDVAREAGVGVATVSRVVRSSGLVAPATRARVEAAMGRLGYRPNPVASALRRGRSQTVEIIVPLFTRYFYIEVLRGVEAALLDSDYALVLRSVERAADRDAAFGAAGGGRADGLLVMSLAPTPALLRRLAGGLPTVLIDAEHPGLASIAVDHELGGRMAVAHLLRLGHQRIALIDHPEDPFTPDRITGRQRGYRRALAEAGLAVPAGFERVTDYTPEAGMAALEELLATPEPPTAVFVGSDVQAIGVLDAARQRGLAVPGGLAVVGYNDIELAQYLGLTTVRVPMREMGRRGFALLLERIEQPAAPPVLERLALELVVRRTCGAAAAG